MSFIGGSSDDTWHPVMTADTTVVSYWLNWRFCICVTWVLISMTIAYILIWRHETCHKPERAGATENDKLQEMEAFFYDDETWMPCLKGIHPAWLLAFRICAFLVLLVMLIAAALIDGASIFYYYTQWTVASVMSFFLLGSIISIRGCYEYHMRVSGDKVDNVDVDAEQGNSSKSPNFNGRPNTRKPAEKWAYVFQIMFQMNAGAVMLTDCVFWFILVPFLAIKDYHLNVLVVSMHTFNAIFLLGDSALNCMRFPWFRIAYFFIWTILYVVFQWILHACVKLWWPYPFLDLSSSYSPLWYFVVAFMHIPCYGIFAFIIKLKHAVFARVYPESYQCMRQPFGAREGYQGPVGS